ncbi:MAG: succinate dehydrogenase [Pseudomonadota bacterium]
MRYLTDRKRATGMGSGRDGTAHHWHMVISSILMVFAVPALVIVIATAMGRSFADVGAYLAQPGIALITVLSAAVIIHHVMNEALEAIEDYVHGTAGKLAQVATRAFAYILIAAAIFAVARIAL